MINAIYGNPLSFPSKADFDHNDFDQMTQIPKAEFDQNDTYFIKKKVHSFIAMHPHKYIYFYFATIVILLPLRRAALQVSCNEVGLWLLCKIT